MDLSEKDTSGREVYKLVTWQFERQSLRQMYRGRKPVQSKSHSCAPADIWLLQLQLQVSRSQGDSLNVPVSPDFRLGPEKVFDFQFVQHLLIKTDVTAGMLFMCWC